MLRWAPAWVAPGPFVTPMPLMSAAETPSAGHDTAPIRSWLGVAVPTPALGSRRAA